ncbi:formylglycine-generating enzyme family protein [Cumulibacter soli]|uniref:formylglycine-generating enzyme family protein n=1 Tax=Cumulibacter soli TaxID=2546344 RepID=UPI001ABA1D29|nr:formylglycine-generating enzyme family protein [Cumulibacter soli]
MPRVHRATNADPFKDMVQIPAGKFVMGSDKHYPEERPAHLEHVSGFWMDQHPVTNAEFRRFVRDTGHQTVAEIAPTIEEFPDARPEQLLSGSLVFTQTDGPVPLDNWQRWWQWVPGATWKSPLGPGSTLHGLERHPVVHVAFEDARAYAEWAGKELASEVEWEYAARGGRAPTEFAWGDELEPRGRSMANTWRGEFPWQNLDPPGRERTTPVGHYRENDWGLVDMIGNVWEWTTSTWTESHAGADAVAHSCCAPESPLTESDRKVMKGGSHICAPSYCRRYRPPARQGQSVRSSTSHLGFRCVIRG